MTTATANVITLTSSRGKVVRTHLTDSEAFDALANHRGDFAAILRNAKIRFMNWTHDQRVWAHILALEVLQPRQTETRPTVQLPNMETIAGMFQRASQQGLKFPKVRLQTQDGRKVVLSRCGDRSRTPGAINVTDGRKFGENTWYGRINVNGQFNAGRDCDDQVLALLREFSDSPLRVARRYGQLTGNCCFCGRDLTDGRSVLKGYGPVCAEKYGLEWGTRPSEVFAVAKSEVADRKPCGCSSNRCCEDCCEND